MPRLTYKIIFPLSLLMGLIFTSLTIGAVQAATYYIAPDGDDNNGGTRMSPWKTFVRSMTVLKPGDTLLISDGIYHQSLNVAVSGMKGHPVTIKALNDGQAIIDGQSTIQPCSIRDQNFVDIEGLVFKNSPLSVVEVARSSNITFRRVSASKAGYGGKDNNHVFDIAGGRYLLLEDCAASGYGRVMYDIYEVEYAVLRRCWGHWTSYSGAVNGYGWGIQVYGADNATVENCVLTAVADPDYTNGGIAIWANTYNKSADNNRIYGNVVHGLAFWSYLTASAIHNIAGNRWVNDAAINNTYGFFQRGDSDLLADSVTIAQTVKTAFEVSPADYKPKDSNYILNSTLKNSSILLASKGVSRDSSSYINSFSHTYNNLYDISHCYDGTSAGIGEQCNVLKPKYDIAAYGKGAYLMRPSNLRGKGERRTDIGAEVLYRYQNGVLTGIPLWPWPMEERIFRETGISPTWEKHGGLWKTLDGIYLSKPGSKSK